MNIELEVHGVNELSRIAKAEAENVISQLQKYIGQTIRIATGSGVSKKFVIEFLNLAPVGFKGLYAANENAYLDINGSSIWLTVRIALNVEGNGCHYWNKAIYLGVIDRFGVLESVIDGSETIYHYPTVEEVTTQITEYKELISKATAIQSKFQLDRNFLKEISRYL